MYQTNSFNNGRQNKNEEYSVEAKLLRISKKWDRAYKIIGIQWFRVLFKQWAGRSLIFYQVRWKKNPASFFKRARKRLEIYREKWKNKCISRASEKKEAITWYHANHLYLKLSA